MTRLFALVFFLFATNATAQITVELQDYAALPITGAFDGKTNYDALLARVSGFREEPGGANRLFVTDLNGPLYVVDKNTKKSSVYLDFNGREGRPGIFHKLFYESGYGSGLNTLYFDPDYRRSGKFYTVHIEDPALPGSNMPDNANFKGFNIAGYTTTPAIRTPGPILYEGVLVEWTDTNPSNATFEGTARELLRIQYNTRIHLLADLIFNPAAKSGDADWRVLYISSGDGGSGEATTSIRSNPQRLDDLVGKVLRIIPDLNEHVATSTVSENGRYRIPNDNPFVSKPAGARKEIWVYGMRNPHRLSWAVDPANSANNRLIADSIGLHTWETVNIIRRGANYGYSQREGNELLQADNKTAKLPAVDKIPVQVSDITDETVVPTYPVIEYGHVPGGGDAIGSGFLYNGKALPALRGKYVFGDITTGRIWYADYKEMLAADDGNPATLASTHELKLRWNGKVYDSMFPIAETGYRSRGGKNPRLSGTPTVAKEGRTDARLAMDVAGELYVCTRSDGMIRAITGVAGN